MNVYGMSDRGAYRAENEDFFAVSVLESPPRIKGIRKREKNAVLAVVCDGMGGSLGGEIASRLAGESIEERMRGEMSTDALLALTHALDSANRAVYSRAKEDESLRGMGTTVAAAVAYENMLAILSVGDSRIYLWHDGRLLLLTHDHSYVQSLVDAGQISAEEARRSAHKNLITRAVGISTRVEGDTAYCFWEKGDKLLLCTDGLTGAMSEGELSLLLSADESAEDTVKALIKRATENGSKDNVTALLLVNTKENQ